jgi:hypothetical protein
MLVLNSYCKGVAMSPVFHKLAEEDDEKEELEAEAEEAYSLVEHLARCSGYDETRRRRSDMVKSNQSLA